jgi:hypothetical protein
MIFKPGDKVKCAFFGDEVFLLELGGGFNFPICFKRGNSVWEFLLDGRYSDGHTHPVLTLVERPKEKVKRKLYVCIKATDRYRPADVCAFTNVVNYEDCWEELDLSEDSE